MSDGGEHGLIGWIVGASGAIATGFAAVVRWVRSIDNRMTVAESSLEAHREDISKLGTTLSERSRALYETRDAARDSAKDIALVKADVARNGAAIAKLERVHQEVMDGIKDILRRLPER